MARFDWIEKRVPEDRWVRRGEQRYALVDVDEFMARSGTTSWGILQSEFKEWQASQPTRMYISLAMVDGEPWAVAISRDIA